MDSSVQNLVLIPLSLNVSITNGLNPGENVVTIDVYPVDDEKNKTTYTFRIVRPYNPSNTINNMQIYPNGEKALAFPTYLNKTEGSLFQYDEEKKELKKNNYGSLYTYWSSSVNAYKTYIFGSRTKAVSVYPSFAYANQRVMIYVNGEKFEEAVTNWKSTLIPVSSEEETVITFHVNSEKYHVEKLTAGVEDPFEIPEKVYTIYVESVEPLGIDSKILSAELEGGEFYQPGFDSSRYTISALVPDSSNTANLKFTVPDGIEVYKGSVAEANKLTPINQDEEGNHLFSTPIVTITGSGYNAYSVTNIILQVTDEEGNVGKTQYAFTVNKRGTKDIYPDSVEEYLCLGSQYTNLDSYGTMPERTLTENGGVLSLGNFGGYIVYKYDTPIQNNPYNPYGIDFIVYGNPFGAGAHEPGYVQVSQDGKTWYTLAGSDHYENHNDWNYTITYRNSNGQSAWTASDGASGVNYKYPLASSYPYYNWTEALKQSITASGYRLDSGDSKDVYGSAAAVLTDFGYADVNTNGAISGTSNNPYNHPGTLRDGGDQFDLEWAVDNNGMPVHLDSISYIKIATASSIYAGAIGEKSTEVTAVNRVTNTAASAVGETVAPMSILVNGKEISVPENGGVLTVNVSKESPQTEENSQSVLNVSVQAGEEANIYINNKNGSVRSYTSIPDKKIIRIIVQEGEKEPYICYLKLKEAEDESNSHVHKFGAWVKISDATLKADAVQKRTCTICGVSETQTIKNSKLKPTLELPDKMTSLTMKKGKAVTFAVTMTKGDKVSSVKSSATNTMKASLDSKSGKITLKALKKGSAKLTINLASGLSKIYNVKVTTGTVKTDSVAVTNVTNKKLTLEKGKTFTLQAIRKPITSTQSVTYKTSNKKVATVTSKGKIKAVAAGSATITVTSGKQKVKITVTVPGMTNLKSSVTVKKGKSTTLKPKTYGISQKVTYLSSNPLVATVNANGKIIGVKKGNAKITVQADVLSARYFYVQSKKSSLTVI